MSILTLVATLLFLSPVTLETGKFNITKDGKKIGSEQFTISARRGGGYLVDAKTQLSGDSATLSSKLELDQDLNPISYEYSHGKGAIHIKIDKPTSEYETESEGKKSSTEFRFPDGGFIVDSNFFSHYVLLLYKVGATGGKLPLFVPQDQELGIVTVRPTGNNVFELDMGYVTMEATTDKFGKLIKLVVPSAKVVIER